MAEHRNGIGGEGHLEHVSLFIKTHDAPGDRAR